MLTRASIITHIVCTVTKDNKDNLIDKHTSMTGKPVLGQLVDDYLLDFDIFHVSHVTELTHYIDAKESHYQNGGMLNPYRVFLSQEINLFRTASFYSHRITVVSVLLRNPCFYVNFGKCISDEKRSTCKELETLFLILAATL